MNSCSIWLSNEYSNLLSGMGAYKLPSLVDFFLWWSRRIHGPRMTHFQAFCGLNSLNSQSDPMFLNGCRRNGHCIELFRVNRRKLCWVVAFDVLTHIIWKYKTICIFLWTPSLCLYIHRLAMFEFSEMYWVYLISCILNITFKIVLWIADKYFRFRLLTMICKVK